MKLLAGCSICAVLILVLAIVIGVLAYRAGRGNRARRRVMRVGEPTLACVSMCGVNLNDGGPSDGWAIALISPDPKVKIGDLADIQLRAMHHLEHFALLRGKVSQQALKPFPPL